MKIVKELPEIIREFDEQRRKSFLEIKEYKDKGIPVVGMYCAYFPPELAIAAGAVPVALCSFSDETIPAAERVMPKSMCPLVKSSYGFAIEDKCPLFHFADLVIGETTCDGKKKMYEMMMEFKSVHVMELPNSQFERGYAFWKQEILRTKEYLEEFFHVEITEEKMRWAVHLNNQIRESLKSLSEVMKLNPTPVSGEDIQKLVLGSKYRFDFESTPEVVAGVRDKILEEYRQGKKLENRVRILVTGCPVNGDSLKVIRAIENNGGVVVATENCSGVRALSTMVDEDTDDIYEAIARKYLSIGCSIMTPNDNRIELLSQIIDEYHVDGVVEVILTGCHATGAESFYIRKFVCEEKHIPYISVDTNYSSSDFGQISTRLTAFIEMIQAEHSAKRHMDMNYCYKIVLSGSNTGKSEQDIIKELWEYTGIPLEEYDKSGRLIAQAGTEDILCDKDTARIEKRENDSLAGVVAYATPEISKRTVEEIAEILLKHSAMKEQRKHREKKRRPDYLWILAQKQEDLELIKEALRKEHTFIGESEEAGENNLFFSCMQGAEDRERLIKICRGQEKYLEGRVLIGNGFSDIANKEGNKALQEQVMRLAKERRERERVCLTEQYYYELAVDYIGEKLGEESVYPKELEAFAGEEAENAKELYETLYWYLKMNRNVASTAAKMRLHRNTLFPRIARLNEMMNVDELDGEQCEKLLLVMEVEHRKKRR